MLLPGLPIAAPRPAVSHCVTGGAGKLSGAGWLGVGVLRVCTGEDTLGPLSSTPASGELSPCRINNGGCQDLCLLTHQGHVNCSCRGGRILQDDFTCQGERGTRALRGGPWAQTGTISPQTLQQPSPHQQPSPPKPQFLGERGYRRSGPSAGSSSPLSPAVNSSCRAQDEFECANGECINFGLTCDGVSHCKDKSDEKPSYCSKGPHPDPQAPTS